MQAQLLPRGHGPHLAGLLRQLRLLGAELHQPVERHEGPGDHAASLARHVRGQVSVKSIEYSSPISKIQSQRASQATVYDPCLVTKPPKE